MTSDTFKSRVSRRILAPGPLVQSAKMEGRMIIRGPFGEDSTGKRVEMNKAKGKRVLELH